MAQLAYEEAAELYLAALDAPVHVATATEDAPQVLLLLQIRTVLALARAGSTDRAQEQLEKFGLASRHLEEVPPGVAEDVAALRARLTKDRALAAEGAERDALARESAELYEAIFVRLRRPYACVNAATMWLLAGDNTRATGLAASALQLAREAVPESPADAYWLAATEAEAALLLGDSTGAEEALRRAVAQPAADLAARMVTRRQLEMVCATKGVDTEVLNPLGASPGR